MHKSQDSSKTPRFQATPIALLSLDDEGSQTPKRQNLASTAHGVEPSFIMEHLSLSFDESSANQTKTSHIETPEKPNTFDKRVPSPTQVPTPSTSDRAQLTTPAIKQPAPALKTSAIKHRPSAAALRKKAQFQVQRERQRQEESDFQNKLAPKGPSEEQDVLSQQETNFNTASLGVKKVTSSTSRNPPGNSVNFLADPSVRFKDDNLLAMPSLSDEEDFKESSRRKLSYKKSNSIVSLGEGDINTQQPQPESMPNVPNNRKQTVFQEAEQMAEAQKSLESLSPVVLEKLIEFLSSDKSKTSTNMKELMNNNPPGCFVVQSDPGLYHLLEPKTLATFVAMNWTSQRTHVVGKVTVHKEEEKTPLVKSLCEMAGKEEKKDRIIYEV
jgi:hypothetical protein